MDTQTDYQGSLDDLDSKYDKMLKKREEKTVVFEDAPMPQELKEFYITEGAVEKMKAMMRIYKKLNNGRRVEFYVLSLRSPEKVIVPGVDKPVFLVNDFYLPGPQENDPADVDVTSEGLMKIAKELPKGFVPFGWMHTHPYGCKHPSVKDNGNNPKVLYVIASFNKIHNGFDKVTLNDRERGKDLESKLEGNRIILTNDYNGNVDELCLSDSFAQTVKKFSEDNPCESLVKSHIKKRPSTYVFATSVVWSGDDEREGDVYVEVISGKVVDLNITDIQNPLNKNSLKMNVVRGPQYQLKFDEKELEAQLRSKCVIPRKVEKKVEKREDKKEPSQDVSIAGANLGSETLERLRQAYKNKGVEGLRQEIGKDAEAYVNYYEALFSGKEYVAPKVDGTTTPIVEDEKPKKSIGSVMQKFWFGKKGFEERQSKK